MQLTKHTDLCLRVLMYLAVKQKGLSTIAEIADRYKASRNHLVKVVHELARIGYVHSVRGRGGGIRLNLEAQLINVGELMRRLETNLDIINCDAVECPLRKSCRLQTALKEATEAFNAALDQYTIADLVKDNIILKRLTQR